MSLDFNPEELRKILYVTSDIIVDLYKDIRKKKIYRAGHPSEIRTLFSDPLPEKPEAFDKILEEIKENVIKTATLNISPNFFAYFTGGANQAAIPAEMLAAALNQNMLKWHCSPAATEMERQVVRWICEFIGYPVTAGGLILSGGSQANFEGLAVARKIQALRLGASRVSANSDLLIYCSSEGHSSIDKSADMLGIGIDNVIKIPVNNDHTIDCQTLSERIRWDKSKGRLPFCIVGNAGTTNTGAVDSLDDLAVICEEHKMWFHIDAAYGGPAAGTGKAHPLFKGLEKGDSVVIDPHKWFYIPFEAGCLLVKDPAHLRDTFSLLPDYLRSDADKSERFDFMEYSFELTRNFKALKVWTTFKAYGAERIRRSIEEDIEKIQYLGELIDKASDFERLAPSPLSVLCFRYRTPERKNWSDEELIENLNKKILEEVEKDGRVFISGTKVKGRTAIRAACINHRTTMDDIKNLLEVLRELGLKIQTFEKPTNPSS